MTSVPPCEALKHLAASIESTLKGAEACVALAMTGRPGFRRSSIRRRDMLTSIGLPGTNTLLRRSLAMPFWRLYYHAVWATKYREPVVLDAMIDPITRTIEQTTRDLGVTVFAVGVMPDHIHVFAQIPPALEVAAVIGRWKGASSHAANEHRSQAMPKLVWQSGYGVLSVSQSGFDQARDYVQHQRERHASRELYGVLERSGDDDPATSPM